MVRYFCRNQLRNDQSDKRNYVCIDYLIDQIGKNDKNVRNLTVIKKNDKTFSNFLKLAIDDKFYVNEIIFDNVMRKPYLDLETIYASKKIFDMNFEKIIKKLQIDIIKIFDKQYGVTISKSDILLANSSGKVDSGYKISLHIVVAPKDITYYYTNSKYSDSSAFHLYTCLIALDESYLDILDKGYNTDASLRVIGAYKSPDDLRKLQPIDVKTFKPLKLSENEKLNYLITYVDGTNNIHKLNTLISKQTTKRANDISKNKPTRSNCTDKITKLVQKFHPSAQPATNNNCCTRFYDDEKCCFYSYTYDHKKEVCAVSGRKHAGTNNFYVYEQSLGFYLKCHSPHCDGRVYLGYIDEIDDFLNNAYQINSKFILKCPNVKEYLDEWMTKSKVLCIKSAMATGKTFTVEHVITKYKFKKILWIVHRQSLTKSLHGKFKDYGFINYMDCSNELYEHDRLFVQIDSLFRIVSSDDFDDSENSDNSDRVCFKQYDLVIIDEIEGCLNHFNSPFLNKNNYNARNIFDFMLDIINTAGKLLLLDADVGIRTKLFIENFNSHIVINNSYKPQTKIFTITNDQTMFEEKIFKDVKKDKNICIVSMSSDVIEKIAASLGQLKIKYILHTSKSDDKLKVKLEDVNTFWVKYQVVLFSPTIESGIDFNKEHFHKIYSIMRDGPLTCSQRQHLQQIGRIRHIKDNNVLCWYKISAKKPVNLFANIYTFDDVLSYFRYYETLNGKRIMKDSEYETIVKGDRVIRSSKKAQITLFDKINLHNEVEQLNKHPDIFLTILNRLITKSGHKIKILPFVESVKKDDESASSRDILIQKMLDIKDSDYNFQDLKYKQSKNKLNEIEKLALKKFYFKMTFGIKDDYDKDEMVDYLHDYLGKEVKLHRYNVLFGYKNLRNYMTDSFQDGKEKTRINIITDLINRFTGKNYTQLNDKKFINIKISNDEYVAAIDNIAKESIYFKNEKENRALFCKKKEKIIPYDKRTKKSYTKTIQSLLESYNIILTVGKRVKIGKKLGYEYILSIDEQIRNILIKKE